MGRKLTELEVGDDGVAVIAIVNPPMNFLDHNGDHRHILPLLIISKLLNLLIS